jgi:hypothetical protein
MRWLLLLLSLFTLFSIFTYKHYGITWDEKIEILRGSYLLGYLSGKVSDDTYFNMIKEGFAYHHLYPAILEAGSVFLNFLSSKQFAQLYDLLFKSENLSKQFAQIETSKESELYDLLLNYENIHLLNLLFNGFLLIAISYTLFYRIYKIPLYAILGVIFILLTPRIIGHMPTNLKDIPFATFYFATICMIIFTFNKPSILKILILIPFFFLTQSSRFIGYTIYTIYILYSIIYYIYSKPQESFKTFITYRIFEVIIIFMSSSFLTLITWPYLGKNYFQGMSELIKISSKYPFHLPFLTAGKDIYPGHSVAFYIFAWYFAITPVPIFLGLILNLLYFKRWNLINAFMWLIVLFITMLFLIIRPHLYDELRQILFYQVLLSCLSAFGFIEFLRNSKNKIAKFLIILIFGIFGLKLIYDLKKLHPYEYIYFNELVGGLKGASNKFETDYWSACKKEAFHYLIKNRDLTNKKLYGLSIYRVSNWTYYRHKYKFLISYDSDSADYVIAIKRWGIADRFLKDSNYSLIYEVKRDGVPLCFVFERK